jgi:hypothetical protein
MRCQLAHLIDVGGLVPGANPASFMSSIICIRNGDLRVFLGLNGDRVPLARATQNIYNRAFLAAPNSLGEAAGPTSPPDYREGDPAKAIPRRISPQKSQT